MIIDTKFLPYSFSSYIANCTQHLPNLPLCMYCHFVVYSALKTTLHAAACITPTRGWGHQSHPGVWRTKPQHIAHSSILWETETWKTPEKNDFPTWSQCFTILCHSSGDTSARASSSTHGIPVSDGFLHQKILMANMGHV